MCVLLLFLKIKRIPECVCFLSCGECIFTASSCALFGLDVSSTQLGRNSFMFSVLYLFVVVESLKGWATNSLGKKKFTANTDVSCCGLLQDKTFAIESLG
jgi:hypothetical protein